MATQFRTTGFLITALLFAGCSGTQHAGTAPSDASVGAASAAGSTNSTTPAAPSSPSGSSSNPVAAIALQGVPPVSATVGSDYSFQPTVTPSNTVITFTATGLPAWLSFDTRTGALSGTPAAKDQGTTGHIIIAASNGSSNASMTPFTIQVKALNSSPQSGTTGSVKLSWAAPTENTDGTPVTNLAGYHIYYGTSTDELTMSIDVVGATSTTYLVEGLLDGTYYFSVLAYNTEGADSGRSNITNKTI
jgi:hypothetical protein